MGVEQSKPATLAATRTPPPPPPPNPSPTPSPPPSLTPSPNRIYDELKSPEKSLRLLTVEPSGSYEAPLACRVKHARFSKRPVYYALSYRWGSRTGKKVISINDVAFKVGDNLFNALVHLRNRDVNVPIWVDAICINQMAVDERNKQVRIMHLIYERANKVLVWLGASNTPLSPHSFHRQISHFDSKDVVLQLGRDPYWDRLWIVQEIGRARQIEVCYANNVVAWPDFIRTLSSIPEFDVQNCGALRLHQQLEEKYSGSHTLRSLLCTHQGALCKDRRDKVYGLVGLATDASALPIDYAKSLLTVALDAITVIWENQPSTERTKDELISIMATVKSALVSPVSQPWLPSSLSMICRERGFVGLEALDLYRFGMTLQPLARVILVGPSTKRFFSSVKSFEEWKHSWQTELSRRETTSLKYDRHEIARLNDSLMRSLLDVPEASLAPYCFGLLASPGKASTDAVKKFENPESRHLRGRICGIQTTDSGGFDIGIAADAVKVDDIICSSDGLPFSLLVRDQGGPRVLVGTLLMSNGLEAIQRGERPGKNEEESQRALPPKIDLQITVQDMLSLM